MRNLRKILIPSLIAIPAIALAQLDGVENIIDRVGDIVELLIITVAGIAVLVFFWGLVKFILSAGNEIDKEKGKNLMIWGTIALFVMVSIWGIIYFIANQIDPSISPGSEAPSIIDLIPSRVN